MQIATHTGVRVSGGHHVFNTKCQKLLHSQMHRNSVKVVKPFCFLNRYPQFATHNAKRELSVVDLIETITQ